MKRSEELFENPPKEKVGGHDLAEPPYSQMLRRRTRWTDDSDCRNV
jgi:hypothetical protein